MNFNQIKNSEFVKNVITMLSGTTAGQFIAFLMLPVVARLYTPVQFGEYSLFISIASVIAVIASGRYELSIVLIKKDINAFNLFAICSLLIIFTAFITYLLIFFSFDYLGFFLMILMTIAGSYLYRSVFFCLQVFNYLLIGIQERNTLK